jgi:hypothetical protein
MNLSPRAASSIASALPSWRVLLLFGGFLTLSESIALATTFFVGAFVSFVASLLIATAVYRRAAPGAADAPEHAAPSDPAPSAAAAGDQRDWRPAQPGVGRPFPSTRL